MSLEPIKLSTESTKRIEALLKQAQRELLNIMVKSFVITISSVIPISIITVAFGMVNTAFPMVAGLTTALLVHFKYVIPNSREIGNRYKNKVLEILEEEKSRQ